MKRIVAIYLILFLTGCTSIRLKKEEAEESIFSLSIFSTKKDMQTRNPGPYGVLSELFKYKNGKWEKIKATMAPAYTIIGIQEGKYLLKIEKYISEKGHIEDLKGKKSKVFQIKKGERININVLLKAPPPVGLVVVGVMVGVAVIWALYELIKEKDLPLPISPPVEISPLLPDVFFHISLNYPYYSNYEYYTDKEAPKLIANYPLHKDPNVPKGTHIFLNFSEPVKENWEKETLQVIGEKSGKVSGKLVFNSIKDIVEFIPEKPFMSGEKIYVTLNGDEVEDTSGNIMKDKVTFYFIIR